MSGCVQNCTDDCTVQLGLGGLATWQFDGQVTLVLGQDDGLRVLQGPPLVSLSKQCYLQQVRNGDKSYVWRRDMADPETGHAI